MFNFSSKLTGTEQLTLKTYSADCSLSNLSPGVDNIHTDVHLSPAFCESAKKVVRQLFFKHTKVKKFLDDDIDSSLVIEKDEFKRLCRDVLLAAVNKAKSDAEIQIDLLAQISMVKWLIAEVRYQYKKFMEDLNNFARKHELSSKEGLSNYIKIKEKISDIQQNKKSILLHVGSDLFRLLIEVQQNDVKEMREAIWGAGSDLPDDVLSNPILHVEDPFDDYFMTEKYVLMGHRFEDPDNYQSYLFLTRSFIRRILLKIFLRDFSSGRRTNRKEKIGSQVPGKTIKYGKKIHHEEIDAWLKHVENIDILFNCFKTKARYKLLKKGKTAKADNKNLKNLAFTQEKLLNIVYKGFKKAGLTQRIAAYYEMKPIYLEYCPPLAPQQVLQFLINPKQRKQITDQIHRLKGFYQKSISLEPLKKKIRGLKIMTPRKKKEYLIHFLNGFARYHRDFQNFLMVRKAMERIHLVSEENMVDLSRANRILYEFLLPYEKPSDVKQIINHVVVKADIRDSTFVAHQMHEKGLNPASFFNLNFFVPITGILFEYTAEKVLIDGDAIILSISEYEDTPETWYSVARACGLAIHIFHVVQQYNEKGKKYNLPTLKLGIGICHSDSPPTFLFDESNRIMISPAIDSAGRMSQSRGALHEFIHNEKKPFNLYVFQKTVKGNVAVPPNEWFLRYNSNGIELDAESFKKLAKEIDLETFECHLPDLQPNKFKVYTGKFPTTTAKYQRLIIREARIPEIDPDEFKVIRLTDKTYYEVCTHPILYEYIENL